MSEIRYQVWIALTPDESIRLTKLAKKLKLSKSATVGMLVNMAQTTRNGKYGKCRIVEDSLNIKEGATE